MIVDDYLEGFFLDPCFFGDPFADVFLGDIFVFVFVAAFAFDFGFALDLRGEAPPTRLGPALRSAPAEQGHVEDIVNGFLRFFVYVRNQTEKIRMGPTISPPIRDN